MSAPVSIKVVGLSEKALATIKARGALCGLVIEQLDGGGFLVTRPTWGAGAAVTLPSAEEVERLVERMRPFALRERRR